MQEHRNWASVAVLDAPLQLSIPVSCEHQFDQAEGSGWTCLGRVRQALAMRWGVVLVGVCVQSLGGLQQLEFSANRSEARPITRGHAHEFWALLERDVLAQPSLFLSRAQVALHFDETAEQSMADLHESLTTLLTAGHSLEAQSALKIVSERLRTPLRVVKGNRTLDQARRAFVLSVAGIIPDFFIK